MGLGGTLAGVFFGVCYAAVGVWLLRWSPTASLEELEQNRYRFAFEALGISDKVSAYRAAYRLSGIAGLVVGLSILGVVVLSL